MGKYVKYNYAALLICVIACLAWGHVLDLKYFRFGYDSWDLPLYANLMWNLCHGSMSTSLFGGNFLQDHFNAIAFLLVPFYYFFQSALTLLYFKLIAFFAGAYIFYLLAAKRMGGLWAIAFMLAYMFYPANVIMIFFEFNFENLALPMILLLFYFFEEKKYWGFITTCFLLTLVKENMPLVVFMFGIYGLLMRREDKLRWVFYPAVLGLGMFTLEVFVIIPWFRHGLEGINAHLNLYDRVLHHPGEISTLLFNRRNALFISKLFGPLLVTALLAPQVLLIASPLFLQDLLSQFFAQQTIDYFTSSDLAVFIFMATIIFLGRVPVKFKGYLCAFIIILLCVFESSYIPQWHKRVPPYQEIQTVGRYILSQVPKDAKVVSSFKFMYMLAERKDLYGFYIVHPNAPDPYQRVPDDVDYMMIDFSNKQGWDLIRDIDRVIAFQGPWSVLAAADGIVLLKKNAGGGSLLIKAGWQSMAPRGPLQQTGLRVDDALDMEGLELSQPLRSGQRTMKVVYYWRPLKNDTAPNLPPVSLSIFQGGQMVYSKDRVPFYNLPISKGRHYMDVFYYFIPPLKPGNYMVVISAVPPKNAQGTLRNLIIKNISVI